MINLIKSDLYKLFRMTSFYVCCIVAAGLAILQTGLSKSMVNMLNSEMDGSASAMGFDDIKNMLLSAINSDGNWVLLVIIAVALFVTIEYNAGTLKNIAARGCSRENIFFSKLIVSIVEALIICFLYAIIYIVTCFMFFDSSNLDGNFFAKLAAIYAVNILIAIASTSFIVMIAYLLRSKGGTIAISICLYLVVIPMVLQMVNIFSVINSDDSTMETAINTTTDPYGDCAYYWIGSLSTKVGSCYDDKTLYIPILIALAYLIVSVGIGLAVFKKRDIK